MCAGWGKQAQAKHATRHRRVSKKATCLQVAGQVVQETHIHVLQVYGTGSWHTRKLATDVMQSVVGERCQVEVVPM